MMQIDRIDHLVLPVQDIETTCAFYQAVVVMGGDDFFPSPQPRNPFAVYLLAFGW